MRGFLKNRQPRHRDPNDQRLDLPLPPVAEPGAMRREPRLDDQAVAFDEPPARHSADALSGRDSIRPDHAERNSSLDDAMRAGLAARGRSMLGARAVGQGAESDEEGIPFDLEDRLGDYAEEPLSADAAPIGRAPGAPRVGPAPTAIRPGKRQASEAQVSMFPDPARYQLPPLMLLSEPKKIPGYTISQDALEQNARLLEGVLEDFSVRGEIINVRPGPVVTLYELEPAPGTKSSRVIGLAEDIARSMSAVAARVAVVSGRNAIGIELPNSKRETVFLRELLASADFESSKFRLPICLVRPLAASRDRRTRQDAASAGGGHDRLGQIGRHQHHDPFAALPAETGGVQTHHDRSEDAGTVGL